MSLSEYYRIHSRYFSLKFRSYADTFYELTTPAVWEASLGEFSSVFSECHMLLPCFWRALCGHVVKPMVPGLLYNMLYGRL